MKKQTKLIAGLGALALGGLLVATQVSGNSEDFQGRFSVKQNTAAQQMSSNKIKQNGPGAAVTQSLTSFKMPETAASKSVDEMLVEVPPLIKAAEGFLTQANNSSDSVSNSLEQVVMKLDAGDASGALNLLDSAESELSSLNTKLSNTQSREDKLQDYNDVLEEYLEEDWPNLIELLEDNLDQAQSELQSATREAFLKKIELASVTQEVNTLYTEYSEVYLALREAETHQELAPREKQNFEDGVDAFQEMHADNDLTEIEMYGAIEDLITDAIPLLRTYHPNIKDDDNLYITSSSGREEVGRIVREVIPNKYQELTLETLPATIRTLSVSESLKERALTAKQNERSEIMEELEELEEEIERLTDQLSASAQQGQNAAEAMIDEIQEAMMNGMQLTNQIAAYFAQSNTAELESNLSSHTEMIELYRSLAEQLQALE